MFIAMELSVYLLYTLVPTSALQESINSPESIAMELGSGSALSTDPANVSDIADPNDSMDSFDKIRNIVVGGVIGAGSLLTLGIFIICGILHCYYTSDKVIDLDSPIEYTEVKEHEVWINFDVLEQLDPSIRANIDLDYLALLTNTDPALLEKYKVQPSPGNKEGDSTYHSWASSLHINSLFSPAKISLQGVHTLTPSKGNIQVTNSNGKLSVRRSSTVRNPSLTSNDSRLGNDPRLGIKRVSTCTDISSLLEGGGLNLSQSNLHRLRQSKRGDASGVFTSNLSVAPAGGERRVAPAGGERRVAPAGGERRGSTNETKLAMDLLRLFTVAKVTNSPVKGEDQEC